MREPPNGQPDPLKGLDAIPWASMAHAYGSAWEIPGWLTAVRDGAHPERDQALLELWGSICHQGTVYEATAWTVPFIARLATVRELPLFDRASLLHLLSASADGTSYLEVHQDIIRGSTDQDALRHERAWVVAARSAVASELRGPLRDIKGFERSLWPPLLNAAHHLGPQAAPWRKNVETALVDHDEALATLAAMADHAILETAAPVELLTRAERFDPEIAEIRRSVPPELVEVAIADQVTEALLRRIPR